MTFTRPLYRHLLPVACALLLAACGEDESSSVAPAGGSTLTGSVVKGVTAHAIVTITTPDDELLATTESNEQGAYAVILPTGYSGAVKITATARVNSKGNLPRPGRRTQMRCDATGGCKDAHNVDVAFGTWFDVPVDFRLSAVASVDSFGIRLVNVTPLSTLAAEWAALLPQGLNAESADLANSTVAAMFGMALSDLEQPTGDIADPLWLNLADAKQIELSLLYASFAEIARELGLTQQAFIDQVAASFAGQGGGLLQSSSGSEPSIDYLTRVAQLLLSNATLGGVIDMPDITYAEVNTSIDTLLGTLQSGEMTAITPVSYDDIIGKLGPLGAQIDEVLVLSGLRHPQQFILDQAPYFTWLVSEDNLHLAPLAVETVMRALDASLMLDILPPDSVTVEQVEDIYGAATVTLSVPTKTLTIVGTRHGQTVNLTLGLTGLFDGMNSGDFIYSIDGTATNPTASGEIHGTLTVDTGDTDFQPLFLAFFAVNSADTESEARAAAARLQTAINNLAHSLQADVTLAGNAHLMNEADSSLVLGGDVTLTGMLDLGAEIGETIARLDVASGQIFMPAKPGQTNHLHSIEGLPLLTIVVGDNATLVVDGAGELFGIPEAIVHGDAQLDNARLLFEHVRSTLLAAVGEVLAGDEESELDIGAVLHDLFDFDFSQLALHGAGRITIAGLGHEYRATLENLTATVYQPHSEGNEDIAFTATLDLEHQKVHFGVGPEAEPWDLRVLTTPTPRLVLIGPAGEYGEVAQEDVYAFLGSLPLGDLLGGLFPSTGESLSGDSSSGDSLPADSSSDDSGTSEPPPEEINNDPPAEGETLQLGT